MNENENSYYNPEQLCKLQEHGVIIPDLSSVRIGREASFCKLDGSLFVAVPTCTVRTRAQVKSEFLQIGWVSLGGPNVHNSY